jgi:hypothetical protein
MIEFGEYVSNETEREYPNNSKIAYVSLGEGAYGLIIVTPSQEIFIEEIPQYGGMPMYDGEWKGSVEDAVLYIKSHFV